MFRKNHKLVKLGELSLAGAALAGVCLNANVVNAIHVHATDSTTVQSGSSTNTSKKPNAVNWGKLDAKEWQGHVDGNYFVLDSYSGDPYHVIVPNEADLQTAGIDTQGKQVRVTSKFMHSLYLKLYKNSNKDDSSSIKFSNTNGDKVKAIDANWSDVFAQPIDRSNRDDLRNFDGSGLDTSNITNMSDMFSSSGISDISTLKNWNTSNVTNMSGMFSEDYISDLTPLKDWNTSNVTNMSAMFYNYDSMIEKADFSKWNFSNLDHTEHPLNNFISANNESGVINLGDNKTLPSWFMDPESYPDKNVTDKNGNPEIRYHNGNVFTSTKGKNIILTSNPKLLANPNKDFNYITFLSADRKQKKLIDTPVFINSTFDNILQDAKNIQQKVYTNFKQENPKIAHRFKGIDSVTQEVTDPVYALNVTYWEERLRSIDMYFHDAEENKMLDEYTHHLSQPDRPNNNGPVDYSSVMNDINNIYKLGYGYGVSEHENAPYSELNPAKYPLIKNWDWFEGTSYNSHVIYNITPLWEEAEDQTHYEKMRITYQLYHRHTKVSYNNTKTTNDIIPTTDKRYPSGVDESSLNRAIKRTIYCVDDQGKTVHEPIVQTIKMHRDADIDIVTGKVTYTDWTIDGDDSFAKVDVPKIGGYTPDKNTVKAIDKPDYGKNYDTTIVYNRNNEDTSITYVDDTTGKVIKTDTAKPKIGDKIIFETNPDDYVKQLESKGYELVSNNYKDGTTASQDPTKNKFTVHMKHHMTTVERTKDVHENITYKITDKDGKVTTEKAKNVPVLHFKQTGLKDAVTGQTDWNGTIDAQSFTKVAVPKRDGYVSDVIEVPAKQVNVTNADWDKDHDVNVTVNYTPEKKDTPVTPNKPETTKRTPEDTSIFGKNLNAQKDNDLPEMAENKSGVVAAGLGIVSLAGLAGLAGVQIKKQKHEN